MSRWALLILMRLTALLPLTWSHRLGVALGWLLACFSSQLRNIAERNLALCFPEYLPAQRQRMLRNNLVETSKCLSELGALWLWPRERVLGLVQQPVIGEELLAAAVQRGRGVLLLTPHLGSWELAGLYYSSRYPLSILYRPSRIGVDDITRSGRGRFGGQVVATNASGLRNLLLALRKGEVLGILPDQDTGGIGDGDGLFAPFFNIPAVTMTLVSRLALKNQAPVFLTWAQRLPDGRGYVLHLRELPQVANADSLFNSVAALNQGVEAAVRSLPEQYLWSYKRFKTRPLGDAKLY